MADTTVFPVPAFRRRLHLTGDKSISHRSLMFSALQNNPVRVFGLSEAADPMSTRSVLQSLGVPIRKTGDFWEVTGVGRRGFTEFSGMLDAGNSGTTIRLMCGILAGQAFRSVITGDASIQKRPMNRVIKPLSQMGAAITGTSEGKAPLTIEGAPLTGIDLTMEISSAQVKSAVLLAGLLARGKTIVREPELSRNHTELMLGIKTWQENGLYCSESSPDHFFELSEIHVPGDPSSAAFWCVAAAIIPDSEVVVENILLNPTRTGFITVLKEMGADITVQETGRIGLESVGTLTVRSSGLKGTTIEGSIIPSLIDEIPILAIAGAVANGSTTFKNAAELRVKECDRIAAMVTGLRAMGAEVEEFPDGFTVHGPTRLKGAEIESHHDHRIAMSFAVAGLLATGSTFIRNSDSVGISYPAFWKTFFNE